MTALTRLGLATQGFRGGGGASKVVKNIEVDLIMADIDVTLVDNSYQVTLDEPNVVAVEDHSYDVEVED